ncbi:MAG: hypothetical protein M3162_06890 [Thermoproteota archaeon]|nr:hypothetical protein [Thermoproteota archaeon]
MEIKNPSTVEGILGTLHDLEQKSERLNSSVEEMRKRLSSISQSEIDSLKNEVIDKANKDAQIIIEKSRQEAEEESVRISKESDNDLSNMSKKIDSSFDMAVEMVVQRIISDFVSSNTNSANASNGNTVDPPVLKQNPSLPDNVAPSPSFQGTSTEPQSTIPSTNTNTNTAASTTSNSSTMRNKRSKKANSSN